MLECRELNKFYRTRMVLDHVSLQLEAGKIYGLLGENGSGKTTWMKIIAGLIKPSSGQIFFDGHPLSFRDKGEIAYMPTEPFFYDYMKVSDVGRYYEDFFPDFQPSRFLELTGKAGLEQTMKARELSSGMNAKLRMAATLSRNARVYLLDEPLNGIDFKARELMVSLILEAAGPDKIVVFSTHLLEEAESFIDTAVFLKSGRILCSVNAEEEREQNGRSITDLYRQLM